MSERFFIYPDAVDRFAFDWGHLTVTCGPSVNGAGKFSAGVVHVPPGQGHARHNHPGSEEIIYVLEGAIEIHTEFYDPGALKTGQGIYLDSSMGHAYVVADGFDEALVLGVCSSADDGLMDSLMSLHG